MRIAVDVMGGDHAPQVNVDGALNAARQPGMEVVLVGQEDAIRRELGARKQTRSFEIIHAPEVIEMDDHPATSVRRKKESSIVVGMRLVKDGRADAFFSAGNTGAMMAAALLVLGRISGVDRPAIGSLIPTPRGRTLLIDAGANADVRPENLLQFGLMGAKYMELATGKGPASVGLLSNGEEDTKGNAITLEAHALLRESGLSFHGNVEGRDIPKGTVDVVVADGFAGNVALKAMEGTARMLTDLIREQVTRGARNKLAALALRPAFRAVARKLDPNEIGGSPLLGVRGVVFIGHGSSNALAVARALSAAKEAAGQDLVTAIGQAVAGREDKRS